MSIFPSPLKSAVPQASKGDWSLMVVIFQRISPADAKERRRPVARENARMDRPVYGEGERASMAFKACAFLGRTQSTLAPARGAVLGSR